MNRLRTRLRAATIWLFLLPLGLPAGGLHAADLQQYDVDLKATGNAPLDSAVRDSSVLISLREKAPVGGFALVQRGREDAARFEEALRSFGYYKGRVSLTVNGHPIADPALVATILQAPAHAPIPVVIRIETGPQFHLGQVTINGVVPDGAHAALNLTSGQPALARDVVAARDRLLAALLEAGYPLAKVTLPPAVLHPDQELLDVAFDVERGPHANLGPISFTGLKATDESYLRRRLLLEPGEPFSPSSIEKARRDLASIGVFSSVRMIPAERLDAQGDLPLEVAVIERPLHAIELGAAYSTDLGASLSAGWHHRNLFGQAEQLNLIGSVQMGGNATTEPSYNLGAQFVRPDFRRRDQALEISLNALQQKLPAYDQTALIERVGINRQLSPQWSVQLGLQGSQENITQQGTERAYNLVGVAMGVKFDSTNSPLDPTRGIRGALSVTPTQDFGNSGATFVIFQASGATYFDLLADGRSVIALRGLLGQASGVSVFGMPPSQRFYAGGSNTVRGYPYQSIGPTFPDDSPTGGTAVSAGTVEFRQRILDSYGVVAFVDAGQVSDDGKPSISNWRVGAGAGLRYYTAIGPIRVDVAVPVDKPPGGDSFQLYIGIGQAF